MAPIVRLALDEMNIKYNLELIESDNLLEEYGVKAAPAIIVNNKIVLEGRSPSLLEVKNIISKHLS